MAERIVAAHSMSGAATSGRSGGRPKASRSRPPSAPQNAELDAWVAAQPGVVVHSHGGLPPEQWRGEVDGHSFYFRERHDEWRIELDLRPSGRFARAVVGTDHDGKARYEDRGLDEGEVIARGITDVDGYGSAPIERPKFIADTIRVHLARQVCTLHAEDLSSIEPLLGREVRWCHPAAPVCPPTDERLEASNLIGSRQEGERSGWSYTARQEHFEASSPLSVPPLTGARWLVRERRRPSVTHQIGRRPSGTWRRVAPARVRAPCQRVPPG
jgi:hypothetical protein